MLKRIFYVVAAILIVIWAVGFFVYALGAIVHLLLILAILLIAFRVARVGKNKKVNKTQSKYSNTYYRDKMEAERRKRYNE